jgi:uncharacterized protein
MSIQDQLLANMKQAMRDKDEVKLGTIRMLRAKIKNQEIDTGPLDDEQVQKLAQQTIKQWQDAIQDYKKGDRQDLVAEAEKKIEILKDYLPKQLSDEELTQIINQVKEELGLDQVGPIIGKVKQKVGNQADGSRIAKLANQLLS